MKFKSVWESFGEDNIQLKAILKIIPKELCKIKADKYVGLSPNQICKGYTSKEREPWKGLHLESVMSV